jgi:hypothetical protein
MKRNTLLLFVIIFCKQYYVSQNYLWAKNIGGPGQDLANEMVLDPLGNIYVTGFFSDTADFDPGIGTFTLASTGNEDVFFAKYDNNGSFIWAKNIGGSGRDYGYSIQLDALGNILLCGSFENTVDFDPGGAVVNLSSNGNSDVFLAQYDNTGNFTWAIRVGGSTNDVAQALKVDASGNVVLLGYFSGTVDFDPSPTNTVNLVSPGIFLDAFIAKYNNNGEYLFAKRLGGNGNDVAYSLQLDAGGNIYAGGTFQGTADFDPGPGTSNLFSAGGTDVFLAKYDDNGNYLWAKGFGGSGDERCNALALDGAGNEYMSGYFSGTADFDPGPATMNLVSAGNYDVFLLKCDNDGNFDWARGFGGTGNDIGMTLQSNADGIYLAGTFEGTVDFDPGPSTSNNTAAGQTDLFISRFDHSGNVNRSSRIGSISSSVYVHSLLLDAGANLYIAGRFQGFTDFDVVGGNSAYLSSIGHYNAFMAKYDHLPIGIAEIEMAHNTKNFSICPNPNSGKFYLKGSDRKGHMLIEILDFSGKTLSSYLLSSPEDGIDLGELGPGLYLVKVFNEGVLLGTKKVCVK